MPWLASVFSSMAPSSAAAQNDGQPLPEWNLVSDENSTAPHPAQRYVPSSSVSVYAPVKARSVAACRSTEYASGLRRSRHSSSVMARGSASVDMAATPRRSGGSSLREDRFDAAVSAAGLALRRGAVQQPTQVSVNTLALSTNPVKVPRTSF